MVFTLVCLLVRCSRDVGPRLMVPYLPDPPFARVALLDSLPGQVLSEGAEVLCRTQLADVEITEVVPSGGQGLRVDAFAVRDNPSQFSPPQDQLGDSHVPLASIGQGFVVGVPQKVTGVCTDADPITGRPIGPHPKWQELAVQYSRTTSGTGTDDGMDVHYRTADGEHVLHLPFAITLCAPGDRSGHCD